MIFTELLNCVKNSLMVIIYTFLKGFNNNMNHTGKNHHFTRS